jgi:hypothetical protein
VDRFLGGGGPGLFLVVMDDYVVVLASKFDRRRRANAAGGSSHDRKTPRHVRANHRTIINRNDAWTPRMQRVFTADEVNRLVPELDERLGRVQGVMERLRDARDQLADLRIIWGAKVEEASCPDHEEYKLFLLQFQKHEENLRRELANVQALGCEVKDPDIGLVDFYSERNGEPVLLCWKRGESRVGFYHTLSSGFAGRKPL